MKYLFLVLMGTLLISCKMENPNRQVGGIDVIEQNVSPDENKNLIQKFRDTTYISAYSDVYSQNKLRTVPMTVMLSIRSGSFIDTTIINKITYYDRYGTILKEYLPKPILLKPMNAIDYIVPLDKNDTNQITSRGGTGAHFIVDWGAKYNT